MEQPCSESSSPRQIIKAIAIFQLNTEADSKRKPLKHSFMLEHAVQLNSTMPAQHCENQVQFGRSRGPNVFWLYGVEIVLLCFRCAY